MAYDGSINFDTRIDSRGFNRAINSLPNAVNHLKSSFSSLAKTVGSTFSTVAIIHFGKQCIEASAGVNALNSQIEQTFGSLKNQAESAMRTVAEESGIIETRLQAKYLTVLSIWQNR